MRAKTQAYPAAALLMVLAAVLSGCGAVADGPEREAVSGKVTLDGKPMAGAITFLPAGNGKSAGGKIADGTYSIARSEGPSPGSYRVEIVSVQPTGRMILDRDGPPGSTTEERKNVVSERYNLRSDLRAEVKKDGPNTFDFEITSVPDKPVSKKRR